MSKRRVGTMGLTLVLSVCLAGCGSAASSADYGDTTAQSAETVENYKVAGSANGYGDVLAASETAASDDYDVAPQYEESFDADQPASETSGTAANENVAQNRKLIKRVSLTAETQEFDKLTDHIEKKVESLGGYMENSQVYSGSGYSTSSYNRSRREATYTARVPVSKMNDLVEDVGNNSNITQKSESAEDVTLNYVDNQSRKEALEVEMDRLMEILKQADDVDTIVALESRITEVRYEIQSIESTLRTYDNLVDFATVNITVEEVEDYTPEPVKKQSDWERMTRGFVESLQDVGRGILNFLIGIVIVLPYLVLWAVIILVIVLIVKKWLRGRDKRAEKKAAKKAAKAAKAQKKKEEAAIRRAGLKKNKAAGEKPQDTTEDKTEEKAEEKTEEKAEDKAEEKADK